MSYDASVVVAELAAWQVIFPFDDRITPKKHKMWVCVSPADLYFLRINTNSRTDFCVKIAVSEHLFLSYDSYLHCGGEMISVAASELEYLLARQLDPTRQGVIGTIAPSIRADIFKAICGSPLISPSNASRIKEALGY